MTALLFEQNNNFGIYANRADGNWVVTLEHNLGGRDMLFRLYVRHTYERYAIDDYRFTMTDDAGEELILLRQSEIDAWVAAYMENEGVDENAALDFVMMRSQLMTGDGLFSEIYEAMKARWAALNMLVNFAVHA